MTSCGREVPASAGNGALPHALRLAVALAMGPAVGLGLARFAYALLLPTMRAQLHWSYTAAGAMNTANAIGYLAGAVLAPTTAKRFGARPAFIGAAVATGIALTLTAVSGESVVLLTVRLLAGAGGAVCFVTGAGLAAQLGVGRSEGRAALILGIYFAGGGGGIMVSGLVVPVLLARTDPQIGWRVGWVLLGLLSLLAAAGCHRVLRSAASPPLATGHRDRWPMTDLTAVMVAYLLFGTGYISYMTFIVAFLRGSGAGGIEVGVFWVVLGAAAVAAAFIWSPLVAALPGGRSVALTLGVVAAGAAVPLISKSPAAAFVSALLFGGSFLSVVAAATAVVRRTVAPRFWTAAIATLTIAFGTGQCLGPVLAGLLSDGPGGLRTGLIMSVGVLMAAALVALCQPVHNQLRTRT